MANKLKQYGLFVRKVLANDWDHWSIFSGVEGSGKSTEAIWFCHFVSGRKFSIKEHVVYTPDDYLTAVEYGKPGDSILLDEGGEAWYNLQFASKMNQALDKTAMMCREYNLNIVIAVPYLFYLGKVAIRRHRVWAHVEAKNFQRGYSEFTRPYWPRYGKADIPFWNPMFIQYFPPLPTEVQKVYKQIKHQRGLERLSSYKATIAEESVMDSPVQVVEKIRSESNQGRYKNSRGSYDRYRVMYAFRVSETIARQVCAELNA